MAGLRGSGSEDDGLLGGARLTLVLSAIYAAVAPLQEKQRLATHAVNKSLAMEGAESPQRLHCMWLEMALVAVAKAAGVERMSISNAKAWLRAHKADDVAARLSRLSKARNAEAHPDVKLMDDIAAMAVGESTLSTIDADESASNGDDDHSLAGLDVWISDSALEAVDHDQGGAETVESAGRWWRYAVVVKHAVPRVPCRLESGGGLSLGGVLEA